MDSGRVSACPNRNVTWKREVKMAKYIVAVVLFMLLVGVGIYLAQRKD